MRDLLRLGLALGASLTLACNSSTAPGDGGARDGGATGTGLDGATLPAFAVTQHHNHATRDGLYTAPGLTHAAAASLQRDTAFRGTVAGPVYGQPLAWTTASGQRLVLVGTEQAAVVALDAATGAPVWTRSLGTPAPRAALPCGNIDPLGVTGTPALDPATGTLYVASMTVDGGTLRQLVFALSTDDGSVKSGWPVDVAQAVSGFDASVQNQRGALLVAGGTLYVPYGGHYGDCGDYHGWVIGFPLVDPSHPSAWSTMAKAGGVWAPSGVSYDGQHLFAATGNTEGATSWGGGEALVRLDLGPVYSGAYYPMDWRALDDGDVDVGSSGAVLWTRDAATTLGLLAGKNGKVYLVQTKDMTLVAQNFISPDQIIGAPALFDGPSGARMYYAGTAGMCPKGETGDLVAVTLTPGSQPILTPLFCATESGGGSPIVTTTDGKQDAIVWAVGAGGDNRLHGFDAETGAVVFDGGGASEQLHAVRKYSVPMVAGGRIYVASDDEIAAFAW